MCGIAGIYDLSGAQRPTQRELSAMAAQIHHRGPDDQGYLCEGNIGLAHTRLSIIDLAGGAQPIHNEDKTVWTVFNGEIFNFVELRAELEAKGHRFYTHTDTEVIVHLYEEYGESFPEYLNGQFAIAVWDKNNDKLMLVRDRVGIAPLFYAQLNGRLVFASEVKSILPVLPQAPRLNQQALDQLMTFWSPVSPDTLFEGVSELSPGKMLVLKSGHISIQRYWDWTFPQAPEEYDQRPENELIEQVRSLLIDATRIRLRSDVPVGAYLSGGLDSSVLVNLIHRHSNSSLRTFSIGFEHAALDESYYQKLMIDHIGSDHSRIHCSNDDVANAFFDTIRYTESAVLRTAPTPMRLLSGLVRKSDYKVVLTGEGADEVFGGYDIFKEAKIRQFWAANKNSQWRPALLKRLYPYLELTAARAQAYLQNFFGVGLDNPDGLCFSHLPRWDTTAKIKNFYSEDLKQQLADNAVETIERTFPDEMSRWHPFNRGQYIEAKSLMGGYLLCSQGDRMLMANSVEGRFPFLDHRVIEFANRIPPKYKMKALNEKYLLKAAMAPELPGEIIHRHKQPYRAPDAPAFFATEGNPAPDYVDELLSENKLRDYGYFDSKRVGMLVKKARRGGAVGAKDNQAIVGILSTQIWHHLFIENYQKDYSIQHLN
ncbi:MAG: asparagine synthase (glutamine-hydrolyzing) [Gammaproteobacteria bacterium]|nr:MAG: asparagine synthase (glutamine-hydrolyzing) [Gammaproteobacteria bacterium]